MDSEGRSEPTGDAGRDGTSDSRYWRANIRLLVGLLAIWFAGSFGLGILLVEPLNTIRMGGFPLGFWFAQQGSILIFIALVFIYARVMDGIDRNHDRGEGR
ncbi:MAG: DUF4212 domain-containing protein [bacterium]|nr:DUF4212 domain-containing protein [bacterium]